MREEWTQDDLKYLKANPVMTINPFHNDEKPLNPAAIANVATLCGDILGDTSLMICNSQELVDQLTVDVKENTPRWQEFLQRHIAAIRIKAYGSDMYEPKSGLEVRALYKETLRHCLRLLEDNDRGIAARKAEREKEELNERVP